MLNPVFVYAEPAGSTRVIGFCILAFIIIPLINGNEVPAVEKLLTIREVSELLQVNERTIHRLIQTEKIPAAKVGNQWRFHPSLVEAWFLNGGEKAVQENREPESPWSREEEYQIFSESRILLDLQARQSGEVLERMVDVLAETGHLLLKSTFLQAILERETFSTTGLGRGVALPHAWHSINDLFRVPLVVGARLRPPVDFQAVDGRPVDLVFLLCSPRNRLHLQLLSTMSTLARDEGLMHNLRQAKTKAEFIGPLKERVSSLVTA